MSTPHVSVFDLSLIGLACAAAAFTAWAQPQEHGGVLRSPDGRALYTFAKDADGTSRCYDACATAWPPYLAPAGAKADGPWTLHPRKDGRQQWGLSGQPLYLYAADAADGQARVDGQGGVWHLAQRGASKSAKSEFPY